MTATKTRQRRKARPKKEDLVVQPCQKVLQHRERLVELAKKYRFDDEAADRAVNFIEKYLRHWKAPFDGKPFLLSPFQKDEIVRPLFGFLRPDGTRLFREAYIQLPRKNGKSALVAAILLYIFYTGGGGLEVYTAATKRDQAMIVFNDCKAFVKNSPPLRRRTKILNTELEYSKTSSKLLPLSADYSSMDGLNVSGASIDELHAHKSPHVHDVIATAVGSRSMGGSPLLVKITTAGEGESGVCKDQYEYAEKILSGGREDDAFFCYIAEADPDIPWDDPRAYEQANPNLDVSISREYLERERQKAMASPSYRRTYERYHLNRWVQAGVSKWLDVQQWKRNKRPFKRRDLIGRKCYGGLDLAHVNDLCAFSLVFPMDDGSVYVLVWYWIPEDILAEKVETDRAPYDVWRDQGWIETTPGASIEQDWIADRVIEICEEFKPEMVAYDNWNATHVTQKMQKAKIEMVEFIQGLKSFHTPSQELERRNIEGTIHHDGNPCTTWCVGNVMVKRDDSDKIRPVKKHKESRERIDGVISTIMALDCHIRLDTPDPGIDYRKIPKNFRLLAGL